MGESACLCEQGDVCVREKECVGELSVRVCVCVRESGAGGCCVLGIEVPFKVRTGAF